MSATQPSQLDLEMLRRIAQSIGNAGVVGNDGDLRFDAQAAHASLAALQAQLHKAGYAVGSLAIDTLVRPHDDMDTLIYDTGRYGNLAEAEQAWERDYRRRWHDQIEDRVDDSCLSLQGSLGLMTGRGHLEAKTRAGAASSPQG